jgi:hypothetical protein
VIIICIVRADEDMLLPPAVTHYYLHAYSQAMIEEFDLDQDGEINEQEFLAIMLDGE